jgi:hypothetical protein
VLSFYFFLLGVGAIGAVAYLLLFFAHVPGAREERFGTLSELPKNLGKWLKAREPNKEGLIRERRRLLEEGSGGERILVQVRYRDPKTNTIVRIGPEKVVRRKRVSST